PAPLAPTWAVPDLVDRRGRAPAEVLAEFGEAVCFAEGPGAPEGLPTVDRYGLRPSADLVLLTPPASARVLDEAIARVGARRLVMAWQAKPSPAEERFLPTLLGLVGQVLAHSPYVSVPRLAVRLGELEISVRLGVTALAESNLLAVDEESPEQIRVRRRSDGKGILESEALQTLRTILGESRAFRRFLRKADADAIRKIIHAP
ncbi:MAG TPA: hypothetical protein VD902_13395, partial [Symbiobacteriaceae bacterium]|nr:hypothetical protein [Symbiobacteriaceae bacterium]